MTGEQAAVMDGNTQVVVLRPGNVVTDAEWSVMIAAACEGYGLAPDQVLVTPYGFAPMPRPPQARRNNSGRLWPGLDLEVAIHPVFWLPPIVTRQGESEDDDVYAIRLHLELLDRQMVDMETQQVRNPFGLNDLDVEHPDFGTELVDYANGERVDWLAKFTLPDGPTPAEDIRQFAESIATEYRTRYYALKQRFANRAEEVFTAQRALLNAADMERDVAPVLAAASTYEQTQGTDARRQLIETVEAFIALIDSYGRASLVMVSAERVATTGKGVHLQSALEDLETEEARRAEYLRQMTGRASRHPDDANLAALWQALTQAWDHVVGEAREAAQRAVAVRGAT
jgi:hypothetical protein